MMGTSQGIIHSVWASICSYLRHKEGGVAIIFAVTLFPMIAIAGISIEIGRNIYVNTRLSNAVDAAAVAAARFSTLDSQEVVNTFFYANFEQGLLNVNVTPVVTSTNDTTFTVTAEGEMPTIIGQFLGINSLHVEAQATVQRSFGGMEVALVLDVGGNMQGDQLATIISSMQSFINTVHRAGADPALTTISIVPYAMTVNIGENRLAWLIDPETVDGANPVGWAVDPFTNIPTPNYVAGNRLFPNRAGTNPVERRWSGCVMNRVHGVGELNDDPPSVQKWFAYFAYPTKAGDDNDWTPQITPPGIQTGQSFNTKGPNRGCPNPILERNNTKNVLNNNLGNLQAAYGGGTDATNIVWGWRLLSPRWNGFWGGTPAKEYDAPNNTKAIVLIADGHNEWYDSAGNPTGDPTGYLTHPGVTPQRYITYLGAAQAALNYPPVVGNRRYLNGAFRTDAQARTILNQNFAQACTLIKEKGIQIYTVLFQEADAEARQVFEDCATSPAHNYNPGDKKALDAALTKIGEELKQIRIIS